MTLLVDYLKTFYIKLSKLSHEIHENMFKTITTNGGIAHILIRINFKNILCKYINHLQINIIQNLLFISIFFDRVLHPI